MQIAQCSLGVGIVAGEFFVDFVRIASIRPSLIVGQDSARFFEFMKYLRDDNQKPVSSEYSSTSPNRSRYLKNFGEQDDPWVTAFSDRTQKVGTHWPSWCWDINEFVVCDDHNVLDCNRVVRTSGVQPFVARRPR